MTEPTELDLSGVALLLIAPDGSDAEGGLLGEEEKLIKAIHATLLEDDHFKALPNPRLERIEANRGLSLEDNGVINLRYSVRGAVSQEFWGHYGPHDRVAWKSGVVTVKRSLVAQPNQK